MNGAKNIVADISNNGEMCEVIPLSVVRLVPLTQFGDIKCYGSIFIIRDHPLSFDITRLVPI